MGLFKYDQVTEKMLSWDEIDRAKQALDRALARVQTDPTGEVRPIEEVLADAEQIYLWLGARRPS